MWRIDLRYIYIYIEVKFGETSTSAAMHYDKKFLILSYYPGYNDMVSTNLQKVLELFVAVHNMAKNDWQCTWLHVMHGVNHDYKFIMYEKNKILYILL